MKPQRKASHHPMIMKRRNQMIPVQTQEALPMLRCLDSNEHSDFHSTPYHYPLLPRNALDRAPIYVNKTISSVWKVGDPELAHKRRNNAPLLPHSSALVLGIHHPSRHASYLTETLELIYSTWTARVPTRDGLARLDSKTLSLPSVITERCSHTLAG